MNARLAEQVRRLVARIERDCAEVPSVIMPSQVSIDDGVNYTDPTGDTRPDFAKQALKGWRSIGRPDV